MYGREESGVSRFFRRLDLYPKIDADATKATGCGFMLTMFGIIAAIYLFWSQWTVYLSPPSTTEFYVVGVNRSAGWSRHHPSQGTHDMYVHFNVTFSKMPCNFISVDYFDVFGVRDLDIRNEIKLNGISQDGNQESTVQNTVGGTGRKILHVSESKYASRNDFKGTGRKLMGTEETEEEKSSDDPFGIIPDDVPIIRLNDLERLAEERGTESDLHPSAIVVKIGNEERHVVPGGGEHQVIEESHPIHNTEEGKSTVLTSENFDEFIREHETVLVNFFVPWCHWCQRFAPIWEATSKTLAKTQEAFAQKTRLAKVDCNEESNTALCKSHQVRGYPTVKVYRAGSIRTHKQYHSDRTVSAIIDYVRKLPEEPDALTQFGPGRLKKDQTEHCVAWRQTRDCNPNGDREPENDLGCKRIVMDGASGYCECKDGTHANVVSCKHPTFTCADACLKLAEKYAEKPKKLKHEIQVAHARRNGLMRNIVGIDPMRHMIASVAGVKAFKKMHESDIKLDEPEMEHLELGCTASGSFKVGLIPGSLVFTAYSPWHAFDRESVDMSHVVHEFSFGVPDSGMRRAEQKSLQERVAESNGIQLNTAGGRSYTFERDGHKYAHEHYLRLMQTDIDRRIVKQFLGPIRRKMYIPIRRFFQTFQYSVNSHSFELDANDDDGGDENDSLPSVRFVWDMDPVGIVISREEKTLYSLFKATLAIVGGIFTVFGMTDSVFHSVWTRTFGRRHIQNGKRTGLT